MRISAVEIISMLTLAAARVRNMRAAMPGVYDLACADLARDLLDHLAGVAEVGIGACEGEVGDAVGRHVLHDDIDRDPGFGQRFEDRGRHTRPVGHAHHGDLGHVGFVRHSAHAVALFHRQLGDDHRTGALVEARAHVDAHAVQLSDLDRARMHDLGAHRRQLQDLLVGDESEQARLGDHPRVGRQDAVDVGVDLALRGIERGRQGHRRGVGATAAEGGDLKLLGHALEPGHHRHLAAVERLPDPHRVDLADARLAVLGPGPDAGLLPGQRDGGHAHALQAHRHQGSRDGLAVGDQHVQLAAGRLIADAVRELDQAIGRVAHGRNHRHHLAA